MSTTNDSFSFECPRCQVAIAVGREDIGHSLVCKNCGGTIIVPGPAARPRDAFDDLFEIDDVPASTSPPISERSSVSAPISADDDVWELMPDEALTSAPPPTQPAKNPLAIDDDEPLRLDGINERSGPGQFRVKCPVCESVILAGPDQIGQRIQCSDCFTMIDVVAPAAPPPQLVNEKPKPADSGGGTDDVAAFPELDKDLPPPSDDAEYGLAPASEDLLKPRNESLPPELLELVQQSYHHRPSAANPAATASPSTAPASDAASGGAAPRIKNIGDRQATILPMTESELPEIALPPPPLQEVPLSEQFKWPEKFLSVFADLNVLQFMGFVTILLTASFVISSFGMSLYRYTEHPGSEIYPYRVFGALAVSGAVGIGLIAMFLAGIMINQLIEGAAYKRSLFHPPELGLMELLSSFLIVGVSFWAGMLPGVILGNLFWSTTRIWWLTLLAAFGTAFFLAPLGILSAYYNGSAFQIVSPEVFRTLRTHTAGWMRFYAWMALWVLAYCLSSLFRLIPPSFIGGAIAAFAQAAFLVLIGRTIGLLAQAFINFWIDDEPAKS